MERTDYCGGGPVLSWFCEFQLSFYKRILQIDEISYRPDEEVGDIRLASRMPGRIWYCETRLTSAPILRNFDSELQYIIECNTSDFGIGAISSQEIEGHLHPVAFHSRMMNKHKINYEIHDKELLVITSAFKEWRQYHEGAKYKINVYMDHKGLKWFANNKPLNRRQARWAIELDGLNFR